MKDIVEPFPFEWIALVPAHTGSYASKLQVMESVRKQVGAAARNAVAALPSALLDVAEDALDQTARLWEHATRGSPSGARDDVHRLLEQALDTLHEARRLMTRTPERIESWITGLGGETGVTPPSTARPDLAERMPTAASAERRNRRLEELRAQLSSGKNDVWFTRTQAFARERGIAPPVGIWDMAKHVELKFAVRMRDQALRNEVIVIDRDPCEPVVPGGPSCATLLPEFLPPGARLTVIVRSGTRYDFEGDRS
ncbi:hypothetical protein NLX83_36215 [Allokutzneria sp. A3M-2-11 16]|uniref:DddA-like double-stranded DNA deaminase toxin n=1 Tax=Allokutzneria sp. A3M-2-11 16 TaxID=2962043 RepID=UPI0020B88224|nr:DddA-like double-stranded DNA deaminase toxin [Allokutzneria sp. A3M-2-11 16]MCP3804725.1 hypothetical protein [Allokutzneria sp. A3M-2-11 16]